MPRKKHQPKTLDDYDEQELMCLYYNDPAVKLFFYDMAVMMIDFYQKNPELFKMGDKRE